MKRFNNVCRFVAAFTGAIACLSMACKTGNAAWCVPAVICLIAAVFFLVTHGERMVDNAR